MVNKENILVTKNKNEIIISYDGKKLVKPIQGFEHLSKSEIKDWFLKEVFNSGKEVT